MTGSASPDGTGTQTDEVSRALAMLDAIASGLIPEHRYWTAGQVSDAASVLYAEIERLTRRVEELTEWQDAVLGKCKACDGWDRMPWGGGSPLASKDGWGFVHFFIGHLNTRALTAEAALASAAAPDERVLAERELAQAAFKFVAWAMREGAWGHGDLDGGDVQDKAQALGLIVETQYDPDKHGKNHEDAEPGDQWFVLAPAILDAIRARTPDQDTAP